MEDIQLQGQYNMFSFIAKLALFLTLYSCGNKAEIANNETNISPLLNKSKVVELKTRGQAEYKYSCLYLSDDDEKYNNCAIYLQNDDSIHANQVTDDIGTFKALVNESNHNNDGKSQLNDVGEILKAGTYSVGDEYLLEKSDTKASYKLKFKILEINPTNSIKIEYQVKEYKAL